MDANLNLDNYLTESDEEKIISLPTDKIKSKKQVRKKFKNIKELGESIEDQSQLQPIIISPADEEGIHTIIAGERRWRACKLVGIDVRCLIKDIPDNVIAINQLSENIQREELTYFEIGEGLLEIKEQNNFNLKELSSAVKKDTSYVSRHLKIVTCGEEFINLCKDSGINSISMADDLEKIYSKNQKLAIRLGKKGATRDEIRGHLKKIKGGIKTRVTKQKPISLVPVISWLDSENNLIDCVLETVDGNMVTIAFLDTRKEVNISDLRISGVIDG